MLEYERDLQASGSILIAGMDEAGRGPLAGSIFAAMVIMPLDDIIRGVNDSKKLTPKKRSELSNIICLPLQAVNYLTRIPMDSAGMYVISSRAIIRTAQHFSAGRTISVTDTFGLPGIRSPDATNRLTPTGGVT